MAFLLHQLLTESAKRNPDGIAVDGGESKLTYSQLDTLSNQIAHQLRADGVCNGDRVGVFLPKSPQTVAALLGILKAGAAYVPVDPHSPSSRASYVLGNCSVRALITSSSQLRKLAPDLAAASEIQSILLTDEATERSRGGFARRFESCVFRKNCGDPARYESRDSAHRKRPGLHSVHLGFYRPA